MKTQTFLKGSFILFLSALITKALGALFKIPLTMLLGGVGMGYFGCAYGLFLPIYALSITGLSTAVASLVAKEHGAGHIQTSGKFAEPHACSLLEWDCCSADSSGCLQYRLPVPRLRMLPQPMPFG